MTDFTPPAFSGRSSGDGRSGQELPHDRPAEEALLGSVLVILTIILQRLLKRILTKHCSNSSNIRVAG